MARIRKLTVEKKNAINAFIEIYNINSTGELQEALKDLQYVSFGKPAFDVRTSFRYLMGTQFRKCWKPSLMMS